MISLLHDVQTAGLLLLLKEKKKERNKDYSLIYLYIIWADVITSSSDYIPGVAL
jgi:hypothetical protein